MRVFDWFTSKTTENIDDSTENDRRSVEVTTSSPPSPPSTQEVSKVTKLFNETVLRKTDSLKKAKLKFEEHNKVQASLKRKLDEVERRKKEAELDFQEEKDVQNCIASKKIQNEQERDEISEAQNVNRNNLKMKQNSLDKFIDELKKVHDELKEAEIKKETLQKQIDAEQKDHNMLTSAMSAYNAEAVDASVEAPVEAAVAVDYSPVDNAEAVDASVEAPVEAAVAVDYSPVDNAEAVDASVEAPVEAAVAVDYSPVDNAEAVDASVEARNKRKTPYDSKSKMQENRRDPEYRFNEKHRSIIRKIQSDEKYRPHHSTLTKYRITCEEINKIRKHRNWETYDIYIPPA